ncbi:glycosyltransferase [Dyadobacter alkalitolerans]|uniref:glycosyltransferase n=1 Tax=Dyadobacter alkalitolerans TaxID=492736 RepID=UPI0003F6D2AC|nr:glycosyltransferase [Dyadobacter alkalitolerans]
MDAHLDSNNIVKSLWIGSRLSTLEILCINSFIRNGHDFHLYTYENIVNVPLGAKVFPANEVLPYGRIFYDSQGGVAAFSDWFRYKLLFDTGGWWVDMDMICLQKFQVLEEYCFACERVNLNSDETTITTGVIKSEPGADFLGEILTYIDHVLATDSNIIWGEFGPKLLNLVLSRYNSNQYIKRSDVFCPISWYQTDQLVSGDCPLFPKEALAIHFWNEMWRRKKISKDDTYGSNTTYETLKRLYN